MGSRTAAVGVAVGLLMGMLAGPAGPVVADSAPPVVGTPVTVTSDPLPTTQIDGVAWSQVVVGSRVFVAGSFSSARPAGAAPGVDTVARGNLLAYDLTTGVLDPSFAPVLNGQALAITASPDGSKVFVAGEFTTVNGLNRYRVAGFDVATGALLSGFVPTTNAQVRGLAATNSTLYMVGGFTSVGGQARNFAAAVKTSNGAVLPWNPSADAYANAVTLNSSGSKVIIGGRFQNVGGQAAYGMAATDPVSGAVLPWATTTLVRNAGPNAGVSSLIATRDGVFGGAYHYGVGGNLEGVFRADNETGQVIWIEDCHGDTYSVYQRADVVYQTGHHHYCGNVNSFGQTNPQTPHHGIAFSLEATQTITPDVYGYFNWAGNPAPSVLNWFPTFTPGAVTSSKQAGWSITGTGKYVLYGGEFLRVNGVGQQGLVRFATSDVAPNKDKPFDDDAGLTPALASVAAGAVRVGWQATYDRDNEALTYKVFRNFTSLANTPVYQATVNSTFWKRPSLSFTDTTAVPGQSYSYRVYAFDPFGNSVTGAAATITVAGQASEVDAYASGVLRDGATAYYRLGDAAGATTLADLAGSDTMVPNAGVTLGSPGAFAASSNTAASFSGTTTGTAAGRVSQYGPNTFSVEAWFQTTSTTGGKIVGYSGWPVGVSGSAGNDRHLYMDNAGRVLFGVYQDTNRVLASAAGLNDGAWHHVVGTLAPSGMRLYVDGRRVGSRTDTTAGRYYTGVWKIGGDTLTGWPNQPTSRYFKGAIDDVAVYPTALTPTQITTHYTTSGRTPAEPAGANTPPTASLSIHLVGAVASFDASASGDVDGTITDVYWDFGDGHSATGMTASHSYQPGAKYRVYLSVTDDDGDAASATQVVSVPASANRAPSAAFTSAVSGLKVSLDSAGSQDPDGQLVSRLWDFGDGTTGRAAATSHTYGSAGTFRVSLTVTDNLGATATASRDITVKPRPRPTVVVRAAMGRSRLWVDVDPNKGRGYWTFQVQKRRTDGSWRALSTYRTYGTRETRLLNLPKGTYRVWVRPKYGYSGAMSKSVRLIR